MSGSESVVKNQFSVNEFGEYYLTSVNRDAFVNIDSRTLFDKKLKKTLSVENTLYIIIGLDSGLLANYILEMEMPADSIFLFVEVDEVLSFLNIDIPEEFQDSLSVNNSDQFFEYINSDKPKLYLAKNQVKIVKSIAASSAIVEEYSILFNAVLQTIKTRTFKVKAESSKEVFVTQELKNLTENVTPASIIRNTFKGKTCLIIGGGPSLDDDIEWIKQNYSRLFIITVSRMAYKLSQAGIPAQIIVSVDPYDISFEVNRDIMKLNRESLFIHSHYVNHRILSQWQGESLHLDTRHPWCDDTANNIVTVGPTVTNTAVNIALELGFNQLILSGVDLCHSAEGLTHAKGSVESASGINNSSIDEWVETYSGHLAESPVAFVQAAHSLQQQVANNPQARFINLGANAAKIQGIDHLQHEDISIGNNDYTYSDLLKLINKESKEKTANVIENDLKEFIKMAKEVDKIIALSNKALVFCNKKILNPNDSHAIEVIEEKIKRKHESMTLIIKDYGYGEFLKFLTTKSPDNWTTESMKEMMQAYYSALLTSSKKFHTLLISTIERLKIRLEELKPLPAIEKLASQWRKDNQPGRVLVWKKLNPNIELCAEEKIIYQQLAEEYEDQLTNFNHSYFSKAKTNTSLENTLEKILLLKNTKNVTGLKLLLKGVFPLIEEDKYAERLYYLATSYLCVLEKNPTAALDNLLRIDQNLQTELELRQILLLSFELLDVELSEKTLVKLIKISEEYLPQYANILTLTGNNQKALNVYLDYLDKNPNDEKTLIKFGMFLIKVNEINSAKTVFKNVLSINPSNLTAQKYLSNMSQ